MDDTVNELYDRVYNHVKYVEETNFRRLFQRGGENYHLPENIRITHRYLREAPFFYERNQYGEMVLKPGQLYSEDDINTLTKWYMQQIENHLLDKTELQMVDVVRDCIDQLPFGMTDEEMMDAIEMFLEMDINSIFSQCMLVIKFQRLSDMNGDLVSAKADRGFDMVTMKFERGDIWSVSTKGYELLREFASNFLKLPRVEVDIKAKKLAPIDAGPRILAQDIEAFDINNFD
jgi:hypothetical protein